MFFSPLPSVMISIEQAAAVGLFPVKTFALICLTLPLQQTNKVPNQINKVSNHNKTRPGCFCAKDCLDSKEIVVQKQALLTINKAPNQTNKVQNKTVKFPNQTNKVSNQTKPNQQRFKPNQQSYKPNQQSFKPNQQSYKLTKFQTNKVLKQTNKAPNFAMHCYCIKPTSRYTTRVWKILHIPVKN